MATLRARVQAPKTPGALAAAGVKFVFQSGSDFTNMLSNVRKSITAGLTADQALRALTTAPAELFGVSDRLGTIEVGKIANLTITKGEITDTAAHVTQLFIDGKPVVVAEVGAATPAGGRGGRAGGGAAFDASGRWSLTVLLDGRERTVRMTLQQDSDQINGVLEGDLGSAQISSGQITRDGSFSFIVMVSLLGGTSEAEFNGTLDRNGARGQVDVEGHKSGSFSGSHN